MAVWDSASIQANRAETSPLRAQRESPQTDVSCAEPDVGNRWHPAVTLAFIVLSCGLLWGGIFAAISWLF
jgi:hypothetical protein